MPSRSRLGRRLAVVALLGVIAGSGSVAYRQAGAWYHAWAADRARDRRQFRAEYEHRLRCVGVWGGSGEARFLAARAARRAGDLAGADELLAEADNLGWDRQAVRDERFLLRVSAEGATIDPRTLTASARSKDPGDPDFSALLEVATTNLLQTYRLKEVQDCLNLWLEREPQNTRALLYRGWVYASLGQLGPAAADYAQAVAADGGNDVARLRLAETLLRGRKPEEALVHFNRLQARQPDNPAVAVGLAACRRDLGDLSEARRLLDGMLDSQRLAAAEQLAQRLGQGQPPGTEWEAADWYRQAVASAPYDLRGQPQYVVSLFVTALVERGKLALENHDDARAEACLRRAVGFDPFDYQAINQLAFCLERLGRAEEARKCRARLDDLRADQKRLLEVTKEIMDRPREPGLRWEAGTILLRNGQPREGLRWLHSALREDSRHAPTHEALAKYYESIGRGDRAASHREQAAHALP